MRLLNSIILGFLVAALVGCSNKPTGPKTNPTPEPGELDQFQGAWETIEMVEGGIPVGKETFKDIQATLQGDVWRMINTSRKEPENDLGTYRLSLDPTKSPKEMDLIGIGKDNKATNDLFHGIYSLEGDVWKICFNQISKGPRPKKFESPEVTKDQDIVLQTFKRVK
jgi:uncharacterized protein (TIGR03067 family)